MFNIGIADLVVCVKNKYEYIKLMCHDYITMADADFCVEVTDEEIMRELTGNPEDFPPEYLETLAVYRKIAEKLSEYSAFLMHGVLMNAKEHGIMLCAASGTGKSTHAALWLKLLGDKCEIINGDKPLFRVIDGQTYGYGTPWCGKEGINKNKRISLTDICFIERGEENSVVEVSKNEIVQRLLPNVYIPRNAHATEMLCAVDAAAKGVRFWRIICNMDISAAEVACRAIVENNN